MTSFSLKTLLAVLTLSISTVHLEAIVVADPSNTIDTSSHPDSSFPWFNTGHLQNGGASSATYLGDGWVLAADHSFGLTNDVVLNGTTYQWNTALNGGTGFYSLNSAPDLDLVLFQISGFAPIASIDIYCEPIAVGDEITMVGTGSFRDSYNNNGTTNGPGGGTGDDFYPWAIRAQPVPETYYGTNTVVQVGVDDSATPNHLFSTVFDRHNSGAFTTYEGQATSGDSGGGVYINNNGTWELAGMMFGATNLDSSQSNYGDETFMVDLTVYKDEINALIAQPVPEPSSALFVFLSALAYPLLRMRRR